MTHILNRADTFRAELIDGYLRAHPSVEQVPGASAIMRPGGAGRDTVAIVVGGGGGHFPAFAGFVGEGMATAAVLGEVFTSPSAEQVHRTIQAVDSGAGVVLCIGNYSGDRMNFALAAQRAERAGIQVRTVVFDDDVAAERGIAGGVFVVRCLAAAAAQGAAIDEVAAAGAYANARTATLGVAFGGCRLPGASEPLFTVDAGHMGVGLGIHGEPGVGSSPLGTARELAALLVDRLLASRPADATEPACAVLLNGLGATGLEELYVLYGEVDAQLRRNGVEPEVAHVGQFVTSLDMPGCSLSLCWLDDRIRAWLRTPVRTPVLSFPGSP